MKKLFSIFATFAMLCAVGCEEQGGGEQPEDPIPENIFFGLDKESVTISPDGGSVDVIVYSNYKWEISGTSDWCTPSATSGEANEDGQKVSFSADVAYDNREATFWFRCADEKIKFTVSQSLKEVIIADENNTFNIPAEGGVAVLNYQTSVECEVIIPEEAKSWITIAPADATRGLVAESIKLNIAENATYSARSAVVKVVKVGDNSLFAEYTINQVQNDAIIADENNTFSIPAEGGNVIINYQTTVECEVIIPEEAKSWISIAPKTRALVGESATLTVAENTTYSERSAVVKVVKVGDNTLYAEYTINQVQNDAIIADNNNTFNIKGWEQSIQIAYKTNVECDVIIPEEAKSWISIAPKTRALVNESVTLNVADNNTGAVRSVVVRVVAANNSELLAEYTITQNQRYYIEYTSTDGSTITPYSRDAFGATIVRNKYTDGKGYIDFDVPITSIGSKAFYERSSLTSITIPDSVTSIGKDAFRDCSSLTSITIPDGVTWIGDEAFYGCSSLTSVTIGHGVTSIGDSAFCDCTSLTSVTIPDSVTLIGDYAFYMCTLLTSVTIPDSVTSIGEYAFCVCTSLSSITIPDSVTSIGEGAFSYCSSLTSVTIPDSVTSIGSFAFRGCDSLTSVHITDIAAWCGISFGYYSSSPLGYAHNLYLNGELVTNLVIPDGVTSIGNIAFAACTSLTSITIGNGVTSIGERAFYNCRSLTSVTITDSVTSIGENAFGSCTSLPSITIPDSVTSIGKNAFSYCASLTSITIPDSVTSIGDYTFERCTSLTSVYCKSITPPTGGSNMFYDNASGRKIYVPRASVNAYKSAEYWKDYASYIVGYDF